MYGLGDWKGELEKSTRRKSRRALPHLKNTKNRQNHKTKTAYDIHVLSYLGLSIYQM